MCGNYLYTIIVRPHFGVPGKVTGLPRVHYCCFSWGCWVKSQKEALGSVRAQIYLISYPILLISQRTPQKHEIWTIHDLNLKTFHLISN